MFRSKFNQKYSTSTSDEIKPTTACRLTINFNSDQNVIVQDCSSKPIYPTYIPIPFPHICKYTPFHSLQTFIQNCLLYVGIMQ